MPIPKKSTQMIPHKYPYTHMQPNKQRDVPKIVSQHDTTHPIFLWNQFMLCVHTYIFVLFRKKISFMKTQVTNVLTLSTAHMFWTFIILTRSILKFYEIIEFLTIDICTKLKYIFFLIYPTQYGHFYFMRLLTHHNLIS